MDIADLAAFLEAKESELRRYADDEGIDLDALLDAAGRNIPDELSINVNPPTQEEVQAMADFVIRAGGKEVSQKATMTSTQIRESVRKAIERRAEEEFRIEAYTLVDQRQVLRESIAGLVELWKLAPEIWTE